MKKYTNFVEYNAKSQIKCYYYGKERRGIKVPEHMLIEEVFNDMIEEVSYIKLKAHLNLDRQDKSMKKF